jgi:F-type H+-transporting ATPase subunit b
MADILKQLGINFYLLFIQLVGFLILLWMMKKFLWGRVLDMIQNRTAEIKNAYDQNEQTRTEVDELKIEYEQKLQQARVEAESIVKDAVERAEQEARAVIEKTRSEAEQIRARGLADIEQEKKRVISEIRTEVIQVSVEIAGRLMARQIDSADVDRLTDEVISEIGGMRQ